MRVKKITVILIFALIVSSVSVLAAEPENNFNDENTKYYIGVVIVTGVIVGTIIVKNMIRNGKAAKFYHHGDIYAQQGKWDLAFDEYLKCAEIHKNYKDVQVKLSNARIEAEKMFNQMGDEAKMEERYDDALTYFEKALYYNPLSTWTKSKIAELGEKLVEVHYRRGLNFEMQNRWKEALKEYEKAYFKNPEYQDLDYRYKKAKAMVEENISLRGVGFFVNHSEVKGIETPLILALQNEMSFDGDCYLIDYQIIQEVMKEQAAALSNSMDTNLAMDIGLIVGAEEMIMGEIISVREKGKRIIMDVVVKIISVNEGKVIKTIKYSHKFSKGVNLDSLKDNMQEMARVLVNKI